MVLSLHKLDLAGQVLTQALFFLAVNSGKFRVDVQGALRFILGAVQGAGGTAVSETPSLPCSILQSSGSYL